MDTTPRAIGTPIVIFSFDRPQYLRRFCESLKAQQGVMLDESRIFLLQDGAVSPRTGVRYAEDAAVAQSIAAFREIFPQGQVLASPDNLGIAFNIRRGEALAFETLDAELGYFFEDDLELGPAYLLMMERLRDALAERREVGYFAVYGEHRSKSNPDAPRLVGLDHHWGFALRRDAWRRIGEWLAPYFEILGRMDYAHRNHLAIYQFLQGQEMAIDRSSQDALKAVAAARLGIVRVMTDVCFGRYIGEKGASFNEARFRELGYDRTDMVGRTDIALPALSRDRAQAILAGQQERFRTFRQRDFDGFLSRYALRHWDPDRAPRRDDVDGLFRLLLDRLPEGEHIYRQYAGQGTLRELRAVIFNSREFRSRSGRR
ncbi:MAG: hypothetical protein JWP20_1037 [Roseomonas sp.]|nr:hypothetical protein [Roseomonas sp.]